MSKQLKRVPENNLVMNKKASVISYDKEGSIGALRAVYLLGADIISAIFPRSGSCLDIGCGSGQFTIEYAKRIPLLKVLAFDLSPRMIRIADSNLEKPPLEEVNLKNRVKFEVGDMMELERFKSNSFDAVVCSYTLHHTKTESEALNILNQIKRVLKPEGATYIYDLVRPKTVEEFEYIKENFLEKLPPTHRVDVINSIQASFSERELENIIQQCEFDDLQFYVTARGVILFKVYEGEKAECRSSRSLKGFSNYPKLVRERYELGLRMFKDSGLDIGKLAMKK